MSRRRGAVLIETALVLSAFLMLLLGIIELGRAWFSYNLVTHAVREGTRLAAVKPLLQPNDEAVVRRIEELLQDGGLRPASTTVTFQPPLQTGRLVRVTSRVDFSPVVALWAPQGSLVFPLTVSLVTRYEI